MLVLKALMDPRTKQKLKKWIRSTILISFLYSCLVHLVLLAMWRMGILQLPDELIALFVKRKTEVVQKPPPPQPTNSLALPKEIPLTFIEVEPDVAAPAPPDAPKFYSTANSQAANPEPRKDTPMPESDGRQQQMARLRDVPRAVLTPPPPPPVVAPRPTPPPPAAPPAPKKTEITLQPTPPKPKDLPVPQPPKAEPPKPEPPKPEPPKPEAPKPVEVAKVLPPKAEALKPDPAKDPAPADPAAGLRPRIRSLAQARQQAGLTGEKMKQEGGVKRPGRLAVDAKSTPFGEYDAALIKAVQDRWYFLLDNTSVTPRSGKVVLEFNLKFDGSIVDMRVKETEVGEVLALLCERAVTDPAPYARWPLDMHRIIGGNIRPVTFTFLYY